MTSLAAASTIPKTSAFPRALIRLCTSAQRELWGLRLTRLYGFGVGLSYAALAFVMPASPNGAAELGARCLATASWVAGVGALSLATDLAARDVSHGLTSLARLRGFGDQQLERARALAGAVRLSTTIALPGVMVALAALVRFRSLSGATTALALALLSIPYALLLGGVLAGLARTSSRLLPGRGRLLLLAIVLGPWLLAAGTGSDLPSIPGAFAWLLTHVSRLFR